VCEGGGGVRGTGNAYKFWLENFKGRDHLRNIGEKKILK
jgi:hypothetical protein